jgi:hypothetical protein
MQNSKFKMQRVTVRPRVVFALCILHLALLVSLTGCSAKAKAQTLPDGPPLVVPSAPAHAVVIEQVAVEEPPPELPPAPEPAAPPAPRPAATRTQRPEPRAETPPATQPAAASQPPSEAPAVRATPAAASAAEERAVRALMKKAGDDLEHVDYKKLSKEGQAQYDQSKRFSDQANQAIKERNFPYAMTLAEKAAKLAAELVP